ncbi:sensor histidine kinase [Pelagovum pacificum]|uniref:histidine kinase n=1 Tax=Pelagovum pacificum TaxID=2588711 RepID=A0A5C5G7F2_9RHOB|nr:sensor histidine kinase [Pelagovum pacificum]QQA41864.1 sensor histidine kinase [Pelagovum pacificum]TNY30693.1 sensor histidine kinase [Pelagovum pacificum]
MIFRDRSSDGRGLGLTLRVIILLSIALLPLGLIAVIQTRGYERESLRRSELALLALTERATARESSIIENAVGSAASLAQVVDLLADDPETCSERMAQFLAEEDNYVFAGFVELDGNLECSSSGRAVNLSGSPLYETFRQNPVRQVQATPDGAVSGEWVIVVAEPVFVEDEYVGWISISIPHRLLSRGEIEPVLLDAQSRPLQLVTFNADGNILSRATGVPQVGQEDLPRQELADVAAFGARAFTATSRGGEPRIYAITTVVPDAVYALGVWEIEDRTIASLPAAFAAILFPGIMWLASLMVGSIAMHQLVIVHVQRLQKKMRSFGRNRRLTETVPRPGIPSEFREMDAEFMAMAENVLRDEAQLEDSVREKNILLKEIHHRVKNNLQLLSSITSMKRRQAKSEEARTVLGRLQDRILSLAAIHRNLYQSSDMTTVSVPALIGDICAQQGLAPGQGRLGLEVDDISLVPPQAVPLSLLLAECLSGVRRADTGEMTDLTLKFTEGDMVQLVVDYPGAPESEADSSIIGDHLIDALAGQLGGRPQRETLPDGRYRLVLDFEALVALPDTPDF